MLEAVARAKDALALQTAEDSLADAHDTLGAEVLQGRTPKDQAGAQWQERSRKLVDDAMPTFREDTRAIVGPRLEGATLRLGNTLRRTVEKKDRQDITADMTTRLERLSRDYAVNPAQSEQQAMALFDTVGPMSDLPPDQLARARQTWKEQAQFTAGFEAVSRGRTDRKALAAAETLIGTLSDLDPQRKAQLLDKAQNFRLGMEQQDEMRQNRAARAADAGMRRAESAFKAGSALADQGILNTDAADQMLSDMRGTPYEGAFRQMLNTQRQTGAVAQQPVAAVRQAVDQVNAEISRTGLSPQLAAQRDRFGKVLAGQESTIRNEGGLRAAAKYGVVVASPPLDLSSGLQGLGPQLQNRVIQAGIVSTWTGSTESPLYPEEAEALGKLLSAADPSSFGQMAGMLSGVLPADQVNAIARQLDAKDKPLALALAAGATKTSEGRAVAELIRRGVQAVKDKNPVTKGNDAQMTRDNIAKALGEALPGQMREDTIESAMLIHHGKAAAGERVTPQGAVALALGGPLIEHNGKMIPVPAGVDQYTLGDALRTYPVSELERQAVDGFIGFAGGRPMSVAEFADALTSAQLEPVGRGRYVVRVGGSLALGANNRRVVVEVGR